MPRTTTPADRDGAAPRRRAPRQTNGQNPATRNPRVESPAGRHPDVNGTRERILDIALDLFVEKGYDKTSLREIAEQLGFSKAALYYHFSSKGQILLALHLRLHALGREVFARLEATEMTTPDWGAVLQETIGTMLANRKLLILHERNAGALEEVAPGHEHEHDHDDFEEFFRRALTDERTPAIQRVRIVGALGSILAGLVAYSRAFSNIPVDEYEGMLRAMVADLLPTA